MAGSQQGHWALNLQIGVCFEPDAGVFTHCFQDELPVAPTAQRPALRCSPRKGAGPTSAPQALTGAAKPPRSDYCACPRAGSALSRPAPWLPSSHSALPGTVFSWRSEGVAELCGCTAMPPGSDPTQPGLIETEASCTCDWFGARCTGLGQARSVTDTAAPRSVFGGCCMKSLAG